jgi:alpha-beta hydrolase superfamily lysophospholipase
VIFFKYLNKFIVLCFFLILSLEGSHGSERFALYSYLLSSQDGKPTIRITTNVKLDVEENKVLKVLPYKKLEPGKTHYIIFPGRGDHAEKYSPFMQQFIAQKKDAYVWCIDPYGQGGSEGSVACEGYDATSSTPCCMRRGHATWEDYANAYVSVISAIHECLKGSDTSDPKLILIAHSMAATVDMWARLDDKYDRILKKSIHTVHYVSPMVNFTLFLKDKLGEIGEGVVRSVLSYAAWGLCQIGYDKNYFFMTDGPINPYKLEAADVTDKINPSKADAFIKVCQENPQHEIGSTSNRWFVEAYQACHSIWNLTPRHFEGIKLHVHVPGDDQVVYPHWVENFFAKKFPKNHQLHRYANEPHNLFWGSNAGITELIKNL